MNKLVGLWFLMARTAKFLRKQTLLHLYERRYLSALPTAQIGTEQRNHFYLVAARALGYSASFLGPVLQVQSGGRFFRSSADGATSFDSVPTGDLCGDKALAREVLQRGKLPVPKGRAFPSDRQDEACDFARTLGSPCVIKPSLNTAGGHAVFANISSPAEIRRAVRLVALLGRGILVERFATGDNYRALVLGGRCISIIRRNLPKICGDGRHSIRQLIEHENAGRIKSGHWRAGDPAFMPLPLNTMAADALQRQGFTFETILERGTEAVLSYVCSYQWGATYDEVLGCCHPALVSAAEAAAELFNAELLGVDLIATDCARPEYVINEVNTGPHMELHYFLNDPGLCRAPMEAVLRYALSGTLESESRWNALRQVA